MPILHPVLRLPRLAFLRARGSVDLRCIGRKAFTYQKVHVLSVPSKDGKKLRNPRVSVVRSGGRCVFPRLSPTPSSWPVLECPGCTGALVTPRPEHVGRSPAPWRGVRGLVCILNWRILLKSSINFKSRCYAHLQPSTCRTRVTCLTAVVESW